MRTNFKCWACGHHFEADTSENIFCPQCKSDNVSPVSKGLPKKLLWVIIGILVVVALAFIICRFGGSYGPVEAQIDSLEVDTTDVELTQEELQDFIDDTGLNIPREVKLDKVPTFEGDGYSVKVRLANAEGLSNYYFRICEKYSDKVVAKSNDGSFSGVPYSSADGGCYRIQVVSNGRDSILAELDVMEFVRQIKVDSQMTKETLQEMINTRDESLLGAGENDYLAPDYKISFTGLSADARKPKLFSEVFEKLDNGIWTSAKVTKLGYDNMNRICSITIAVVEDSMDF